MKKIKFSHEYDKMFRNPDDRPPIRAILIEVFRAKSEDLHKRFVEYDTSYYDMVEERCCYYKLPKGNVIVLILKSEDMIWTTIRRYTPKKYQYYLNSRWRDDFEIEINEE